MLELNNEAVRSALIHHGEHIHQKAGSVLLEQGKPSTGIFLLLSGCVEMRLSEGVPQLTRKAQAGSLLGVPATINGTPYSISATAIEDSELIHVSRVQFVELMRSDPSVSMAIIEMLSAEVRDMRIELKKPRNRVPQLNQ